MNNTDTLSYRISFINAIRILIHIVTGEIRNMKLKDACFLIDNRKTNALSLKRNKRGLSLLLIVTIVPFSGRKNKCCNTSKPKELKG